MLTNDPLRAINVTSTSGGQHNLLCLLVGNIEPGYLPHEAVKTVLHIVGYGRSTSTAPMTTGSSASGTAGRCLPRGTRHEHDNR